VVNDRSCDCTVSGGTPSWPFVRPLVDRALSEHGYREDEFFVDGTAARYRPRPGTKLARTAEQGALSAKGIVVRE
jgi:hypothetical protein